MVLDNEYLGMLKGPNGHLVHSGIWFIMQKGYLNPK